MTELVLALRLKADKSGVVGEIRATKEELESISTAGRQAGAGASAGVFLRVSVMMVLRIMNRSRLARHASGNAGPTAYRRPAAAASARGVGSTNSSMTSVR